ncbi:MAG: hypothetical protein QOF40_2469 [Actinomycetota bacterium]|jgi:hypothetical protein|nr:hypothetical protein [Actinomycetota bacterium]
MALGVAGRRPGRMVVKAAMLTLGTVGFVVCLTLLYHSMRAVMDVGGACASGGAYDIRTPCPKGVAWVAPVSVFGMLLFAAIGFLGVFSEGGPRPYVFAWSALFVALGWNFLEYGFDPPGGGSSAGWLVCGFVFVAMGGLPLLALFAKGAARWAFWGPRADPPGAGPLPYRPPPTVAAAGGLVPPPVTAPAPAPTAPAGDLDVVSRLERLADLRDRGLLDADEYELAKDRILRDEVGS